MKKLIQAVNNKVKTLIHRIQLHSAIRATVAASDYENIVPYTLAMAWHKRFYQTAVSVESNKMKVGSYIDNRVLDENWQQILKDEFDIEFEIVRLKTSDDVWQERVNITPTKNRKNRSALTKDKIIDILNDLNDSKADHNSPWGEDVPKGKSEEYVDKRSNSTNAMYVNVKHKLIISVIESTREGAVYNRNWYDACVYAPLSEQKIANKVADRLDQLNTPIYKVEKNTSEKENSVSLHTIVAYTQGFGTNKIDIEKKEFEDINYNDTVCVAFKALVELLQNDTNGVILLHGVAGSGKSTLLKILVNKVGNTRKVYNISYSLCLSLLTDPILQQFIRNLLEEPAILLIEDAEDLIRTRDDGTGNSALINLLQLTDGLDTSGAAIIFTYNTKKTIDSALKRPGRLLADIEVGILSAEKTAVLVKKVGVPAEEVKPQMTLAEIYNIAPITTKDIGNKIGFNTNETKK